MYPAGDRAPLSEDHLGNVHGHTYRYSKCGAGPVGTGGCCLVRPPLPAGDVGAAGLLVFGFGDGGVAGRCARSAITLNVSATAIEAIMLHELRKRGLFVEFERPVPVIWDELQREVGFRADLVVEEMVIVELKSIESVAPVHLKTLLTYLRLADKRLGLLLNFGEEVLKCLGHNPSIAGYGITGFPQ